MPLRRLAFGLLALLASAGVGAAEPQDWLQRMDDAARQQSYIGTLVYGARGQMDTLRIFHRAGAAGAADSTERERLLSLNGDAREVIRHGSEVTFAGTGAPPRTYDRGGAAPPFDVRQLQRALPHYELALAGKDRIAGRPAQVLDVRASDAFRYSYRLWLDGETGLLLKSVRHGLDGVPVELLMFTDIDLHAVPTDEQLSASAPGQIKRVDTSPLDAVQTDTGSRWIIADLPPGFVRAAVERDATQPDEEHQLFSDGLANVSVYIAPMKAGDGSLPVNIREGAISVFSRRIDGYRVYVIGDVPELTVQRFAQGVSAGDG